MAKHAAEESAGSTATGTIFGWAFGDEARREDADYVQGLKDQALENARDVASSRGLDVLDRSAAYTVVSAPDTVMELDTAPDGLIIRCTVKVTGPGAENQHAEGPMNG